MTSVPTCAVEAVLDVAALGGNTGLISSATMLLNASYFGDAPVDADYDMGVLSLAVASGEATPFDIATSLYEQVMEFFFCRCFLAR